LHYQAPLHFAMFSEIVLALKFDSSAFLASIFHRVFALFAWKKQNLLQRFKCKWQERLVEERKLLLPLKAFLDSFQLLKFSLLL
jgi:hypothetical protein